MKLAAYELDALVREIIDTVIAYSDVEDDHGSFTGAVVIDDRACVEVRRIIEKALQ